MEQDSAAVAEAIVNRMATLGITQKELARRSGLATSTLRELVRGGDAGRKRSPATLAKVSTALDWPSGYLLAIANRKTPPDGEASKGEAVDAALVLDELRAIREQLQRIDERIAGLGGVG